MRIIAGRHRGQRLFAPEGRDVRPTTDMVRESIFNIIQNEVYGARVLDLFAGSGAMGIEALSRGAEAVVFCDKDKKSLELVAKNLEKTHEKAEKVICADYKKALLMLAGYKFDIVFLDPPYKLDVLTEALELLRGVIAEGGIVVLESDASYKMPELPMEYILKKDRKYGNTVVRVISNG